MLPKIAQTRGRGTRSLTPTKSSVTSSPKVKTPLIKSASPKRSGLSSDSSSASTTIHHVKDSSSTPNLISHEAESPCFSEANATLSIASSVDSTIPAIVLTPEPGIPFNTPPAPVENTQENSDGLVKLIYEQYDELFSICGGSITQAEIDEVYCLSFVMPECHLRLSQSSPTERAKQLNEGGEITYEKESPVGVFCGLNTSRLYYIYVEQDAERLSRDQEDFKRKMPPISDRRSGDIENNSEFRESCSCLFGNPCVDEYICKDWTNRYAIASGNGWKGF